MCHFYHITWSVDAFVITFENIFGVVCDKISSTLYIVGFISLKQFDVGLF